MLIIALGLVGVYCVAMHAITHPVQPSRWPGLIVALAFSLQRTISFFCFSHPPPSPLANMSGSALAGWLAGWLAGRPARALGVFGRNLTLPAFVFWDALS